MTHPAILGPAVLILQLLLLLFVLLALLLLAPIDLEGRVSWGEGAPQARMRIGWLFGRLHKDVISRAEREPSARGEEEAAPGKEAGREEGKEEEREEEKRKGEKDWEGGKEEEEDKGAEGGSGLGSSRIALDILRTEGFLGNLIHLLRGLFGVIQVHSLRVDLIVGLSDPADTGEAVGLLSAVLTPLESLTPLRARITPSFAEERLEGSAEGRLRIVPIKIFPPIIRFVLSPPTWRAGWRAIRAKRGKR
ncbi:MAG TPA: DUF2953 domain-containing protein [Methanothrix sp.]|nr:DUF2953 domain-containing protein [Methanothrix sp.]